MDDDERSDALSGVRTGLLQAGERVTLSDPKGRRHSIVLAAGAMFHTSKGAISHDELIGGPEGVVVSSSGNVGYLAMRPLLSNFTVTMPRGAAVVYPKDAAQILMGTDIFPGARVLEAGAGSGALTCALLRAIGPRGRLYSYERRDDFAEIARRNVTTFFGNEHPAWQLRVGDLVESLESDQIEQGPVDRVVLDMLAPWECIEAVAGVLEPGGVLCCYVATTPQLSQVVETLRPMADSPSRNRRSRSSGRGTSKDWPYGQGTVAPGTPASWSPRDGWRRASWRRPASVVRRRAPMARITRVQGLSAGRVIALGGVR